MMTKMQKSLSVLFTTGYLTQVGRTEEGAYRLVIPNRGSEVFRFK